MAGFNFGRAGCILGTQHNECPGGTGIPRGVAHEIGGLTMQSNHTPNDNLITRDMSCTEYSFTDSGKLIRCESDAIGDHGLCSHHRITRIVLLREDIAEDLDNATAYLNDARRHKVFSHHRSHSISRVREARQFNHRALILKRELRRLEVGA